MFIKVEEYSDTKISDEKGNDKRSGMFIFPTSLLINKKIISSKNSNGKTGFRVFPPWSQDRGNDRTQVFSESGKKTQRWQLPYFVEFNNGTLADCSSLKKIINLK